MIQNVFMLSSFDLLFLLQDGRIPLLSAVARDKLDICKLLLDHGAHVNLIDKVVQCDLCYSYSKQLLIEKEQTEIMGVGVQYTKSVA